MYVYVLNKNGQPLMPTKRCGKVHRLLKAKKAKVIRRCPFTIKLLYDIEDPIVQDCTIGVDTGSKFVGVAVVSGNKVLYASQVELRDDIKRKMDDRRTARRNRRNRKTRYRKARFLNRKNLIRKDRLPPSVLSKKQSHIDEIDFCSRILPINKKVFEVSQFDTHALKNPALLLEKVKHWGYQKGFDYSYASRKEAVRARDNYTCQICKAKNTKLEVHHIIFRTNGGTDDEDNLVTLCSDCHSKIHDGKLTYDKKPKKMQLKYATQMSVLRSQLLKYYDDAIETFGFVTSENRQALGIAKTHYTDAIVIASGGNAVEMPEVVFYKKRVAKGDYRLCKGARGEVCLPTGKVGGFRKFDKVRYFGEEYFIFGRMSAGYAALMDIFGSKVSFAYMPRGLKTPKMSNMRRLSARKSVLCVLPRVSNSQKR